MAVIDTISGSIGRYIRKRGSTAAIGRPRHREAFYLCE
jgi:hypothetical protein